MELIYDGAYHLRCRFALRSGRTITLEALDQRLTYAGCLEGTPCREWNDRTIADALREAEKHCAVGARPHLIDPARRDYHRTPGDMRWVADRFPRRVPEWLPIVRCIGAFKDVITARDPSKDLSVLVVVWFQEGYAMPIQEPALGRILGLDWDSLATDVEI